MLVNRDKARSIQAIDDKILQCTKNIEALKTVRSIFEKQLDKKYTIEDMRRCFMEARWGCYTNQKFPEVRHETFEDFLAWSEERDQLESTLVNR